MAAFKWHLQKILDLYQKAEELKRSQLGEIRASLSDAHAELLLKKTLLRNLILQIKNKKAKQRLKDQKIFSKACSVNNQQIEEVKIKIEKIKIRQQEIIQEIIKIKSFNQRLDKLRTKARQQFIEVQNKMEQKQLDENFANLVIRRKLTHNY